MIALAGHQATLANASPWGHSKDKKAHLGGLFLCCHSTTGTSRGLGRLINAEASIRSACEWFE